MNKKLGLLFTVLAGIIILCLGISVGSVMVAPADIVSILAAKLVNLPMPEALPDSYVSIIWSIRLPRTLCAFLTGGALAASGAVMQSVLQNPLASSYTLGVSSGASLGAALVIVSGFSLPFAGFLTLPLAGFLFGLATVLLAMGFAVKMDFGLQNHTIILVGMVFSLFVNACLTLLSALARDYIQQLMLWQMGSFASKGWNHAAVLFAANVLGVSYLCRYTSHMDIMTFGDESAKSVGVDTKNVKMKLVVAASFLTGIAVCFTGIIGFIDLVAPHAVRRMFGPAHRYVLPVSVLVGGSFMVLADTAARTILAPVELPVGAVTALIGAPFFAWIYFRRRAGG